MNTRDSKPRLHEFSNGDHRRAPVINRAIFGAMTLVSFVFCSPSPAAVTITPFVGEGISISADGSAIAGKRFVSSRWHAFRWSAAGMQDLGAFDGASGAQGFAISGNGDFVVGSAHMSASSEERAFRWDAVHGMQELGNLGVPWSMAHTINGDGSVVAGAAATINTAHAFRWVSGAGMQDLDPRPDMSSIAFGMSDDGGVITGDMDSSFPNDTHPFRWTAQGGMQDLGTLGGPSAQAGGVSPDGSVIVGHSQTTPQAIADHAFRWTVSGGMQDLGTIGGTYSSANAANTDGSIIVGSSALAGDQWRHATLWTSSLGLVDLNTYLASLGVDLNGWVLADALDISADGSAIVGIGEFHGNQRTFVVTGIPVPGAMTILGAAGLLASRRRRA